MNKTKFLIALVALTAIVVIRMWAIAEPKLWLSGKADFFPRKHPSQYLSLDVGFTIPTTISGLSIDMYTGFLVVGDGPYEVAGKKLGGDFIYQNGGLWIKLGMWNCGIDRDHFYAEIRYVFPLDFTGLGN